ncbi:drug/metabolite transporter (DMT)-like permease [Litoreibacter halocynthiae]|uniref:Drug/metabolite transporter (DMT)-like permease n=1 Tax=Litoreibacter halocynthiae TaxID=1242689 RepID=A0A4V3EX88_9RHOB|nr:DMT family transporter [Litoreibacter halocynthiae]TDT77175.1 drug/metabolite transporter (DMT)-like permease [Litoreibacter halocynthiae]
MNERNSLFGALIVMGAGWGLTQPLGKLAVEGGYRLFGLVFWQAVISGAILGLLCLLRGKPLLLNRAQLWACLVIALVGTVLPGAASYTALVYLPSGLVSILLSLVPMMAFPVAVLLGNENFAWSRLTGLALGLCGVLLIVLPEASLPDRAMVVYIPIALIAPLFYAMEGNYVARWGIAGLDPLKLLFGASAIAALISGPLAVWYGQFIDPFGRPYGLAEWALIGSAVIHAGVYSSYVWLVGRAGPVFAVQVSYLVTAFGVVWAMWLLGERYSLWVWAAFAILLIGLALVQPRPPLDIEPTES